MLNILFVFLGSGLGAVARFGVGRLCYVESEETALFPWATFIVNAVGCLIIGALMAWFDAHKHESAQNFLVVGILGGFTTFSAFGFETIRLIHNDHWNLALLNIAGNVLVGLAAVWVGRTAVNAAMGS